MSTNRYPFFKLKIPLKIGSDALSKKKIFVTRFELSLLLNINAKRYAAMREKNTKAKTTKSVNFSFKKL